MFFSNAKEVTSYLLSLVTSNIGDWIVTGAITFISVRLATKKFYRQNSNALLSEALCNEVRRLLQMEAGTALPDDSLVVFVEYKGELEEDMLDKGAHRGEPARQTIISIGGNSRNTSPTNPRDYGVLGIANYTKYPVLVDFQERKVYYYHWGNVHTLSAIDLPGNDRYWGVNIHIETVDVDGHVVAKKETHRGAMIALPIIHEGNLVGGITFDVPRNCSAYHPIPDSATDAEKAAGLEKIKNVLRQADFVTGEVKKIYFKVKPSEI